jgi:hypothetical protein
MLLSLQKFNLLIKAFNIEFSRNINCFKFHLIKCEFNADTPKHIVDENFPDVQIDFSVLHVLKSLSCSIIVVTIANTAVHCMLFTFL